MIYHSYFKQTSRSFDSLSELKSKSMLLLWYSKHITFRPITNQLMSSEISGQRTLVFSI